MLVGLLLISSFLCVISDILHHTVRLWVTILNFLIISIYIYFAVSTLDVSIILSYSVWFLGLTILCLFLADNWLDGCYMAVLGICIILFRPSWWIALLALILLICCRFFYGGFKKIPYLVITIPCILFCILI